MWNHIQAQCDQQQLRRLHAAIGQSTAARFFSRIRKRERITPFFRKELHWLPVRQRTDYKQGKENTLPMASRNCAGCQLITNTENLPYYACLKRTTLVANETEN